ncbi:MAG: fibronectin type III domain-containing protein, partial [Planctomycetaceae bacterium]|nr:fibronectin type III domain-containing protein [Planctomycetaceae bacterium]
LSLTPETEYEFKIVYDSNSVSHESEIKFVSLSDDLMPSNVSGSSITIRWDDSSFPDKRTGSSYILQYRVLGSGAAWSTAPTPSNNSSTVSNLSANTEYEFRVEYTTDGGVTAYSTLKTVRTKQPVITVSAPQVGKVKLTWTFESVGGYVIQRKADNGTWTDITTLSSNTLRDTVVDNLTAETDYTFRIAYKTAQSGTDYVYSDEAEITTLGGFTVVENSGGSQKISVKWDYVTDSTYRLQYKLKGDQTWLETIADIPKTTKEYTLTSLTPGSNYTIRLTYFEGSEKYIELDAATSKTAPETPTGLAVSEITSNGAKIKWTDNSEYEDDYIIEVTNNVTGIIVKTSIGDGLGTGEMTHTLSNLDTKISYTVKVYAKNAEGSSAIAQATFTTLDVKRPAAVTSIKATATPKSVTLSWKIKSVTDIPDPTNFRIEYYDDKEKNREKLWYEVLGSTVVYNYDGATQTYSCTISDSFGAGDSLTVTLENKTAYQFRIIALAPNSTFGDAPAASIKATTAALVVPSSLSAKNITLTSATISFKDTDKNVSSSDKIYTLYYVAGTKKYTKWEDVPPAEIKSVVVPSDKLTYELTGLKAETIYSYIIESEYSGQKTITKPSSFTTAKMPTATTIKGGYTIISNKYSFQISWKPPAATKLSASIAIQYTLEVSASGKKDTFVTLPPSAVGTSSSGLKYVTFSFADVVSLLAVNNYDVSTKVSALSFRVASTFVESSQELGTSYSSAGRVTLPKFV